MTYTHTEVLIQLARDTDLCPPGVHLHYRTVARLMKQAHPELDVQPDAPDEEPNRDHAWTRSPLRTIINRLNDMTRTDDDGFYLNPPWGLWRRVPGKRGTFTTGPCTRPDSELLAVAPVDPEMVQVVKRVRSGRPSKAGAQRDAGVQRTLRAKHRAQGGVCAACGRWIGCWQHAAFAHVRALAQGGADAPDNGVAMHHHCNWVQGERTIAQARATLKREEVMDDADDRAADAALAAGLAAR